jgi:hypothetical protein
MSESIQNNTPRNDEIDLLDLFRRMGKTLNKWANAVGRAILLSIVFMVRRWLPLGFSIILAVGGSYLLKNLSDSSYKSDLVLRNNLVSNSDLIAYINKLHKFCLEDNKIGLANSLELSEQKINNILDISAFWIIDKGRDGIPDEVDYSNSHNIYDTLNVRMQDRFDISVTIKEPQDLGTIKNAILSYIQRDSLFQLRNRVRLRQNGELLMRLNYDILQLDSLQKVKYFEETRNRTPKLGGQMIFLQEQKTQLIYVDIYSLYARKQALESERDLFKDIVTIISDFSLPYRRENGGLYYAKRLVPVFFSITLLLLILLANRKKIKEIFIKY